MERNRLFVNSDTSVSSSSGTPSVFIRTYINNINKPIKPMLSSEEIVPSARVSPSNKTVRPKGSKFHKWVLEPTLKYKHETPKIRAILEIFEPIAVPRAISSFPLRTADIPTNTSGADVPAAISVKPITRSPTPKCLAMTEAWSTNLFAPQTRIIIPTTSRMIFKVNSMTVF